MYIRGHAAITLACAVLAATAVTAVVALSGDDSIELVVPATEPGELQVAPDWPDTVTVDLRRTNTVIIRNDNLAPFEFGGAVISPGQSLVQRFEEPGVYVLLCSAHSAGKLRFVVLGTDGTISGPSPRGVNDPVSTTD